MVLAEKMSFTEVNYEINDQKIKPSKRNHNIKLFIVIGVTVGLIITNLIVQALVLEKNIQIKNWHQQIQEKERDILKLRMEIADLDSFDRVQEIAQNELGMRNPGPKDFVMVKAAPSYQEQLPVMSYLAKTQTENGLWGKLTTWVGEIGKTMAKNP